MTPGMQWDMLIEYSKATFIKKTLIVLFSVQL